MYTIRYAYYNAKKTSSHTLKQPLYNPAQLLRFFVQLLPGSQLLKLPALQGKSFYDRLFTPLVTLWYLLFQRLRCDHTLDAALSDARSGGADRLNKKLSRKLSSDSTCSYSDARQRLPWMFLAQALCVQGANIIGLSSTLLWHGRVLALLDGSTVRLRPYANTAMEFPGNANQHGKPYWCLMRVVGCFCVLSGAALDCVTGSIRMSEQVMACAIILRCTFNSLFIGDSNFGVFRVAQAARAAGQEVLLRMTERRARRLLGRVLREGDHAVLWAPTRQDQLQPGASKEPIEGRLLVLKLRRRGFRVQPLYLFTNLPQDAHCRLDELVRLYGLRWHVELNFRYLKAQMDLAQLEAKSPDMVRKEWFAGLLAYNLIRAAQLCAALQKGISPLTLSFSSARRRLEDWLQQLSHRPRQGRALWAQTLNRIGRCRHPIRRKPRPNEPRAQRHLRLPYKSLYGCRAKARRSLKIYASKS